MQKIAPKRALRSVIFYLCQNEPQRPRPPLATPSGVWVSDIRLASALDRKRTMDQQKHEARQPVIGRRDFLVGTAVAGVVVPLGSIAWAASSNIPAHQTGSMNTRKLGTL
ncbi:twin-arginine translocation signal domain-containing protein, partial [Rhizobium leguminosarum]|uniref:twin-arginine translocation signal domain-containing protein n=1 Tax=Rhizobium leguminosarum TaxID=384 RepID=UPI001C955DDD